MRSNVDRHSVDVLAMVEEPKIGATLRFFDCPHCGAKWIAEQSQYEFEDPIQFFSSANSEVEIITRVACPCPYCGYRTINSNGMSRERMLEEIRKLEDEEE